MKDLFKVFNNWLMVVPENINLQEGGTGGRINKEIIQEIFPQWKDTSLQNRSTECSRKWMHKNPHVDTLTWDVRTPETEAIKTSEEEKCMWPGKDRVPKWHWISPNNSRYNIFSVLKILRMIFDENLYAWPNLIYVRRKIISENLPPVHPF